MSARAVLALVLSLLLIGMQREGYVHALGHDGARLTGPHKQVLQLLQGDTCPECGLLAGGATGLVGDAPHHAVLLEPQVELIAGFASALTAPPVYYVSRAPPKSL